MIRQTSVEAYEKIKEHGLLTNARWKVYDFLFGNGALTGMELNYWLETHSAHKRLSELSDMGLVREAGVRECSVTQQKSIEWDVTDKVPERCRPLQWREINRLPTLELIFAAYAHELADNTREFRIRSVFENENRMWVLSERS